MASCPYRPVGNTPSSSSLAISSWARCSTRSAQGGSSSRIFEMPTCSGAGSTRRTYSRCLSSPVTRSNGTAFERVRRNLKRYRAAILEAAVGGRLVPTEAELARAKGRTYEPASELLQRILAERRRRWEETELERLQAAGKAPNDDNWKAKY